MTSKKKAFGISKSSVVEVEKKNETPVSLGYPLSIFNFKTPTLRGRLHHGVAHSLLLIRCCSWCIASMYCIVSSPIVFHRHPNQQGQWPSIALWAPHPKLVVQGLCLLLTNMSTVLFVLSAAFVTRMNMTASNGQICVFECAGGLHPVMIFPTIRNALFVVFLLNPLPNIAHVFHGLTSKLTWTNLFFQKLRPKWKQFNFFSGRGSISKN